MTDELNASCEEACLTMPSSALTAARRQSWVLLLICAVVAAFALATFLPALDNEFVYDDRAFILDNPAVNVHRPGLTAIPWYRVWLEPYWPRALSSDKLYRPVATLTFRVNAVLAGYPLHARPFRVVNLLLHVLTSVGVVILGWRLTSRFIAGGIAGLLFATHPVHTEAVVTIYGRSELLAGCCSAWLLAIYLKPSAGANRPWRQILLCNGLFFAAIASKEHAIFLWPCLIWVDLWHRRDQNLRDPRVPVRQWFNTSFAPAQLGFTLAAAVFLFLRYLVFGWQTRLNLAQTRIYEVPMAYAGPIEHLLTPFRLLWLVVVNLVWPESLCPIWSYPALMPAKHLSPDVLAGMVLAGSLVVLGAVLWYQRKLAGALVVGILTTLAIPVQALPLANWFYAERWLYLPTILIFVLLGWASRKWGKAVSVAGLAAALLMMPQSWKYSAVFANDLRMMHEITVRQPDSFQGRRYYAVVLFHAGRYSEAIQASNQLIERFGEVSDAYLVLFKSYLEQGDGRRALAAIDKYGYLRRNFPGPGLDREREKALKLMTHQQARAPATTSPATD